MARKRKSRTVGYTIPIHVGSVRIPIHGKTLKSARAKANAFRKHHLKNVEMGFYDASGFHPIRTSEDYSAGREGERSRMATKRALMQRRIGKPKRK
jgi:hypothetical protein